MNTLKCDFCGYIAPPDKSMFECPVCNKTEWVVISLPSWPEPSFPTSQLSPEIMKPCRQCIMCGYLWSNVSVTICPKCESPTNYEAKINDNFTFESLRFPPEPSFPASQLSPEFEVLADRFACADAMQRTTSERLGEKLHQLLELQNLLANLQQSERRPPQESTLEPLSCAVDKTVTMLAALIRLLDSNSVRLHSPELTPQEKADWAAARRSALGLD